MPFGTDPPPMSAHDNVRTCTHACRFETRHYRNGTQQTKLPSRRSHRALDRRLVWPAFWPCGHGHDGPYDGNEGADD